MIRNVAKIEQIWLTHEGDLGYCLILITHL